jgi:predicted dehydrogenase
MNLTRRRLLKTAAAAGATVVLGGCTSTAAETTRPVYAPSEPVRLGFIGLHGRGNDLLKSFRQVPLAQVSALCDVDPQVLATRMGEAKAHGESPMPFADPRRLFDSADIDAVVIATPNHLHAVLASWAAQAGKDVYVEKPVCHDVREGQLLLAVADRTRRIIQAGTQNRSDIGLRAAFAALHAGEFGAVSAVRGFCFRDRASIGRLPMPLVPPAGLDYNLWLGPAADEPIMRKQFHYDWHWVWNTGNGDIGNQGPHELDLACWALGDPGLPESVLGLGGRFAWDDAGETANAMAAWYLFPGGIPLSFEVRNLAPKDKAAGAYHGIAEAAIVVECADGELHAHRGGATFIDHAGKIARTFAGDAGATHQENFITAVRQRQSTLLHAPLAHAVPSADLAHLANASMRIGVPGDAQAALAAARGHRELGEHVERLLGILEGYQIDLAKTPMHIGPVLSIDRSTGLCTGAEAGRANALLQRQPRPGWEIVV